MLTTSRYASQETRKAAREMAGECGERYIARGKKTVEELARLARRAGEERITIIEEREGKPAKAATMIVDELGRWRWDKERLLNSTEN
jgi:rRNA maturation protein Rpf1